MNKSLQKLLAAIFVTSALTVSGTASAAVACSGITTIGAWQTVGACDNFLTHFTFVSSTLDPTTGFSVGVNQGPVLRFYDVGFDFVGGGLTVPGSISFVVSVIGSEHFVGAGFDTTTFGATIATMNVSSSGNNLLQLTSTNRNADPSVGVTIFGSGLFSNFSSVAVTDTFTPSAGGYFTHADNLIATLPEPETYAMLLAGLGLLGFVARRRKLKAA